MRTLGPLLSPRQYRSSPHRRPVVRWSDRPRLVSRDRGRSDDELAGLAGRAAKPGWTTVVESCCSMIAGPSTRPSSDSAERSTIAVATNPPASPKKTGRSGRSAARAAVDPWPSPASDGRPADPPDDRGPDVDDHRRLGQDVEAVGGLVRGVEIGDQSVHGRGVDRTGGERNGQLVALADVPDLGVAAHLDRVGRGDLAGQLGPADRGHLVEGGRQPVGRDAVRPEPDRPGQVVAEVGRQQAERRDRAGRRAG